MIRPDLQNSLNQAVQIAALRNNEYVSLEHLLLSLLENEEAVEILEACGADILELRKQLSDFLDQHCSKLSLDKEQDILSSPKKPEVTLAFGRVIQRAVVQVKSAERESVGPANILVSLFHEPESHAVFFLSEQQVSQFDIINYISHGIVKEDDFFEAGQSRSHLEIRGDHEDSTESGPSQNKAQDNSKGDPLESFTTNLNEKAKKGLIDPLIGRDDVIERTIQVLLRRTKNNPLLVGEPGVGKTAIADGLALRIVESQVPPPIADMVIYSLDLGSMLAGTKYRGDFEARFKAVLKALEKKKHAVLFIDEMHTIIGAGATGGASMDASNLLKPVLTDRRLSCIGSTTFKEYRQQVSKDQAFLRRFQKVDVNEPSPEEAILILKGIQKQYETFHGVTYSQQVIESVVNLSVKYLHGRTLPDKAIDVMDEAGSRARLKATDDEVLSIQVDDIEKVVSSMAQIPPASVSSSDRKQLQQLMSTLEKVIFGQKQALEKIVAAVKLARSGLGRKNKPIGCFLFAGPTGVGKTEVCKQLASILGTQLIRHDMSEYMEKHSVARLIGAPPGYVGFDEGGLLTEAVSKNPYAVLLLDEMEKAHPDINNVFLQVMDSGKLTDPSGRSVDFSNVILVMTSNAGAMEMSRKSIGIQRGFGEGKSLEAIKKAFAPEFLNRLDAIVSFENLGEEVLLQVVDKFIKELREQLLEKEVELFITEDAKRWLLKKGYDPAYGARPMGRAIDEYLKKPLVDDLLFGKLTHGGTLRVGLGEDKLEFTITAKKTKTSPPAVLATPK